MFRDEDLDPVSRMTAPDATGDSRPLGWGVCAVCGEDCDEQDYDEQMRISRHRECLDPDLWCTKHGKALPMSEYGIRYGGCDDCEPSEVTFDEAVGFRCDEARRIEDARRLKR